MCIRDSYTDENCDLEEAPRMTYEDAVKYFFGVMNDDFYYSIADNIFDFNSDDISSGNKAFLILILLKSR